MKRCLPDAARFHYQAGVATLGDAELVLLCGISPSLPSFPVWIGIDEFMIPRIPNKDAINVNKDCESFRLYAE